MAVVASASTKIIREMTSKPTAPWVGGSCARRNARAHLRNLFNELIKSNSREKIHFRIKFETERNVRIAKKMSPKSRFWALRFQNLGHMRVAYLTALSRSRSRSRSGQSSSKISVEIFPKTLSPSTLNFCRGSHRRLLPNTLGQVGEQYGPSIAPFARARCPFSPLLRPYSPGGAARGSHTGQFLRFGPRSCFIAFVLDIPNGVWPFNRAVGRAYIREAVPTHGRAGRAAQGAAGCHLVQPVREIGATPSHPAPPPLATGGCLTSFVAGPQFFLVVRRI
jgi:hypothetical protein